MNKVKRYKWVELGPEYRVIWFQIFSLIYSNLNKHEWNMYMCKTSGTEDTEQYRKMESGLMQFMF